MGRMIELAKKYRIPLRSTEEDLAFRWETVLRYGDRVLLAGSWYHPDGKNWVAAVYEFTDDKETDYDDSISLRWVAEERFEDNGHAISWAIRNA